jgi:hypothetical protein
MVFMRGFSFNRFYMPYGGLSSQDWKAKLLYQVTCNTIGKKGINKSYSKPDIETEAMPRIVTTAKAAPKAKRENGRTWGDLGGQDAGVVVHLPGVDEQALRQPRNLLVKARHQTIHGLPQSKAPSHIQQRTHISDPFHYHNPHSTNACLIAIIHPQSSLDHSTHPDHILTPRTLLDHIPEPGTPPNHNPHPTPLPDHQLTTTALRHTLTPTLLPQQTTRQTACTDGG